MGRSDTDLGGGATPSPQGSREDLTAHMRLVRVEQEGGGLSTEQDHNLTRGGCPCSYPVGNWPPSIPEALADCQPPLLHGLHQ